ncbi:nucleophosmin [Drosophila ficusphila]|uniref:nucleophosmin n=1 Tax=Drosophila ficusphila TaxID=30025 RepID=UPI0007E7D1F4|nr:nucleophosmin [Drosophila ficusphila]
MSNRKSKLLRSLEDSVQPIDHEDVVRLIADQIRQPLIDPIERNQGTKTDLSILHLEDAMKFRDSMQGFQVSPTAESLDEVMPVKNEDLEEMLIALTEEDEDEDEDEEEDEDDDNMNEDDVKDSDYGDGNIEQTESNQSNDSIFKS